MHARIVNKDGNTSTVTITKFTEHGVIIDSSAADETEVTLIPWHRVWDVTSFEEGQL